MQHIQTIPLLFQTNKNNKAIDELTEISTKILSNNYNVYQLYESWPSRILNGKIYRSLVLFGYDPFINDHDKKRWKHHLHKVYYGFQEIDFDQIKNDDISYFKEYGLNEWIEDENQFKYNDPLVSGRKYGWIPVYEQNLLLPKIRQQTDLYYIEGFYNLIEKNLHVPEIDKNSDMFNINYLDGYYNCLGRKIPSNSGSRENLSESYILLPYDNNELEIDLNYDRLKKFMTNNPRIFGMLITDGEDYCKISRYNMPIKLNNKFDNYYARKEYPLDGLV